MSAHTEVQRIDRTGTVWFASSFASIALIVAAIILSGWRPSELPEDAATAWWTGFALVGFGLAGIGYAGCPIYWGDVNTAHHQKSITIRAGLVLLIVGSATTFIAMLSN